MHTPNVNHRYAGWRESVKLVYLAKGALADMASVSKESLLLSGRYTQEIEPLFLNGSSNLIDQTQSVVQRARMLLGFMRRER